MEMLKTFQKWTLLRNQNKNHVYKIFREHPRFVAEINDSMGFGLVLMRKDELDRLINPGNEENILKADKLEKCLEVVRGAIKLYDSI